MINHDHVYAKTEINENFVASSDFVLVLKFDRETFENIYEAFADINEDLKHIVKQRNGQAINDRF